MFQCFPEVVLLHNRFAMFFVQALSCSQILVDPLRFWCGYFLYIFFVPFFFKPPSFTASQIPHKRRMTQSLAVAWLPGGYG